MGSWGPSLETHRVIFTMLLRSALWGPGSQGKQSCQPGPAAVTPGVPSAGTTLLWRLGICPALHPTPPCLGQGPAAMPAWGVGSHTGPARPSGGRGTGRTHTSTCGEGPILCLSGPRGAPPAVPSLGAPHWLHPHASHTCWQTQEEAPTVQNTSGCPSVPVQCLVPTLVPGMPAPDLEGWIPGPSCHPGIWLGWPMGSRI